MPKAFYRRQLPHLQRDNKPHFLTFCTDGRWILPQYARSVVLDCCLHDQGTKIDLDVAVVMPDHVHMIFTPLVNEQVTEVCSLAEIMNAIKGASAHRVNSALDRIGKVRQRLACRWEDYPWIWKKPFHKSLCRIAAQVWDLSHFAGRKLRG